MPKVLSYTPPWLSRPSPGFKVFYDPPKSTSTTAEAAPAVSRTIASRGTQLFVAVGNEIRWTDLVYLKDYYSEKESTRKQTPVSLESAPESLFRVGCYPACVAN
jgi:nucleoporin NUP82